jgi:hypothetical protein
MFGLPVTLTAEKLAKLRGIRLELIDNHLTAIIINLSVQAT